MIQRMDERKEIFPLDDGFLVFGPTRYPYGAFPAYALRAIADELDRRNAPRWAHMEEYFRKNPG